MAQITGPPAIDRREPVLSPSRRTRGASSSALLLGAVSVALCLAIWWLIAFSGLQGFPSPIEVLARGWEMVRSGVLATDALASLTRVLAGFALGTLLAVPLGFLIGWYPAFRALVDPYIQFFRMVPPLAIIPLAIVLMGIGEAPKVFVIFLGAFLSAVVATVQGVVSVDKTMINAARVLGAKDFVIFRRVIIPASTPFILVGMRVGLGSAWATVVAAELIAAQQGLGYRMQQAQLYYDLPTIFVELIMIGVLGLLMDKILLAVDRRLTTWQERR